uniref:Tumor necrosis factor ligand superfamily member 10 n=1 Tax=Oncorhynchus tshawytscha TaxID=74940 RepID=A0AAZ3R5W1_ONCTS
TIAKGKFKYLIKAQFSRVLAKYLSYSVQCSGLSQEVTERLTPRTHLCFEGTGAEAGCAHSLSAGLERGYPSQLSLKSSGQRGRNTRNRINDWSGYPPSPPHTVRSQGVTEELKCLSLLNALDKDQDIPENLAQLFGEPCIKLAEGIKAYISKVTENIISKQTFQEARTLPHTFNTSGSKFATSVPQRPSAHLTLRDSSTQGSPVYPTPQPDLHQSCRHPVRSWTNQSFGAHLHNMTLADGRLRVPQDGRYYMYSQVYFRYPSPSEGDQPTASHQLVQCVYKKTSYLRPIQLLKGVGTKCWAPEAEYALHSVYQGGLFELRAGDELFVSVSSPTMVHAEESSSYFGVFRLDL